MNLISILIKKQQNRQTDYIMPDFKVGDVIHTRMYLSKKDNKKQSFSGVCMSIRRKGYQSSFTLANLVYGQIVYKTIPMHTKLIVGMQVQQSRNRPNKSKLYNIKVKRQIH